jgi:hypothetical protein
VYFVLLCHFHGVKSTLQFEKNYEMHSVEFGKDQAPIIAIAEVSYDRTWATIGEFPLFYHKGMQWHGSFMDYTFRRISLG